MRFLRIISTLVLIAALVGGLVLVRRSQETRRGAFYGTISVELLPSQQSVNLGESFFSTVLINAGSFKLNGYNILVKFDQNKLRAVEVVGLNSVLNVTDYEPIINQSAGTIQVTSTTNTGEANLPTGVVNIFKIKFETKALGEAEVRMEAGSQVVGYNTGGDDGALAISSLPRAVYTVTPGGPTNTLTPRPTVAPLVCPFYGELSPLTVGTDGSVRYSFKYEVKNTEITDSRFRYGGNCWQRKKVGENWQPWTFERMAATPLGRQTQVCTYIIPEGERDLQWEFGGGVSVWYDLDNSGWIITEADMPTKKSCTTYKPLGESADCGCGDLKLSYPLQATPTATPTTGQEAARLNFRMAFDGVKPDAGCANWKVKGLVLTADGTRKDYGLIDLTKDGTVTIMREGNQEEYQVYKGSILLTGISQRNGLALFLKGPKHLQTKYGVEGQTNFYNRAGGELTVSVGESSPIYNFSGYPMLAGDVTGDNDEPDGKVDGRDFAYVKAESLTRRTVNPGQDMRADLDGNCILISTDITRLMMALRKRQEQLY